jgi:hypothetical protein
VFSPQIHYLLEASENLILRNTPHSSWMKLFKIVKVMNCSRPLEPITKFMYEPGLDLGSEDGLVRQLAKSVYRFENSVVSM